MDRLHCYIGQLRTVTHVNGDTLDGYIVGLPGRPFFIGVTIAYPTIATHMSEKWFHSEQTVCFETPRSPQDYKI